jgi:type II secretory pathway pseudopilin PulG
MIPQLWFGRRFARRREAGATLVELIAFIVIVSVVIGGLMAGMSSSVRVQSTPKAMTQALQLAQERIELIRARKEVQGFGFFVPVTSDPCNAGPGHPACNSPVVSGKTVTTSRTFESVTYSIAATIENDPTQIPAPFNDGNFKMITVSVLGPGGKLAEVSTLVSNY